MSSLLLLLPQLLLQLLELPVLPTPSACDRLARLFGRAASMTKRSCSCTAAEQAVPAHSFGRVRLLVAHLPPRALIAEMSCCG